MVSFLPISSPFIRFAGRFVDEAFGVVRGEFEQLARELEATRVQRDEFENKRASCNSPSFMGKPVA